jgi:hypothetical protein
MKKSYSNMLEKKKKKLRKEKRNNGKLLFFSELSSVFSLKEDSLSEIYSFSDKESSFIVDNRNNGVILKN